MFRKAIVVACHPEDNSVDLVMCDDGARLSGVPVMAHSASARSGSVDMPEMPNKTGEDKWNITKRHGQDMEALVAVMGRGNPIVVGFLYPQISQMTFKDAKRKFTRHQSDVYHTIDGDGNVELYHPSGAYVRIAESLDHEDLEKKNFDESLVLDRNKDKKVGMRVSLGGVKIDIKDGVVTIDATKVVVSGDVIAGGVSLKKHVHGGVKSGTELSGPPTSGAIAGGSGGGGSGGGSGGGDTGGGTGGGDTGFVPTRDQYGNLVMWDGNGNHYIQAQRPSSIDIGGGAITVYAPEGDRIYTDAQGNVLPVVTISGANSLYMDDNGRLQTSPDTILTQTIPEGDPLPTNGNKG